LAQVGLSSIPMRLDSIWTSLVRTWMSCNKLQLCLFRTHARTAPRSSTLQRIVVRRSWCDIKAPPGRQGILGGLLTRTTSQQRW
jgi:hypothetical protein